MENNCIRIGMKAPDFSAATTFGPIKLSDYQGKWVVLFSHPGDFTPVCTTEFLAFSKAQPQFEARGAQLLGLSIDSNPSHLGSTPSTWRPAYRYHFQSLRTAPARSRGSTG